MKTKKFVLLVTFLLVISNSAYSQLNKAFFFYKGEDFLSKGQYSMALPYLNTLIGIDSTLSEGWFLRGVAKYNLGDVYGAVADFQKATDVNPLLSQAYNYKAIALNRLMRHNQALVEVRNALDIKPNALDYQYTLGVTYFYLKEYKLAADVFSKMVMFEKTNPDVWINRGTARMFIADTAGALSDFNKAIALNPFNAFSYFKRGALYLDKGEFELAISDLNQSIQLDSTTKESYFVRAIANYEQKLSAKALADLNKVIELDPNYSLALFNRAIIAYQIGNWQDAVIDLSRLTVLNPENVLIYYNRAIIQGENGKLREAITDYSTAINIFPDFANAYLNRAQVKYQLGDLKGSHEDVEKGKELMEQYKAETKHGMFAMLDSSGKFNKLISLESDFNTASRFSMKSNRVKVASAFLPLAKLWLTKVENNSTLKHEDKQNTQWLNDLNKHISSNYKFIIATDVDEASRISVDLVDSMFCKNANYNLIRGIALSNEKKYTEAAQEYAVALEKLPSNILLNLTYIASESDMAQFVEEFTYQSMGVNSLSEPRKNQQIMTAYHESLDALLKLQKKYPDNMYILYNIGNMYVLTNDYNEAIFWFDKALKVNPLFASARYNRGLALLLTGSHGKGCEDLSIAGEQGVKKSYEAMKRFCDK